MKASVNFAEKKVLFLCFIFVNGFHVWHNAKLLSITHIFIEMKMASSKFSLIPVYAYTHSERARERLVSHNFISKSFGK